LVFGLRLPVLRHEARQIIVALQTAGGEPEEITGQSTVAIARQPADNTAQNGTENHRDDDQV